MRPSWGISRPAVYLSGEPAATIWGVGNTDSLAAAFQTVEGSPEGRQRELEMESVPAPLTWAIFTPPKPFGPNPHQYAALRSWLNLRIKPRVYMVEASDLDPDELGRIESDFGVSTVSCRTNTAGLLLVSFRAEPSLPSPPPPRNPELTLTHRLPFSLAHTTPTHSKTPSSSGRPRRPTWTWWWS